MADAILALHWAIVVFIVGGLVAIVAGRGWRWTRTIAFRVAHATAIAVVVAETWLGVACPLTTWEARLRTGADAAVSSDAFIARWMSRLLYYDAPSWVFVVAYTLFGVAVALAWWYSPPVRSRD